MTNNSQQIEEATYEKPEHGWTCFHCGETFTTVGSARTHFGATPDVEPGCLVKVELGAERGLLMALRQLEEEQVSLLERLSQEDTDLHRVLARMQSRHSAALLQAEEAGYARGLRDAVVVPAAIDVLSERERQVASEGWTHQHDDEHDPGDLACAGAAYALSAGDAIHPMSQGDGRCQQPLFWPWDAKWWKPKTPRQDLVRAAALIIAEIERIDRVNRNRAAA